MAERTPQSRELGGLLRTILCSTMLSYSPTASVRSTASSVTTKVQQETPPRTPGLATSCRTSQVTPGSQPTICGPSYENLCRIFNPNRRPDAVETTTRPPFLRSFCRVRQSIFSAKLQERNRELLRRNEALRRQNIELARELASDIVPWSTRPVSLQAIAVSGDRLLLLPTHP